MLSFRKFLIERLKSEHEPWLRNTASWRRKEYMKRSPTRQSKFGDCHGLSCHVAKTLKYKYPSTKVVNGNNGDHSWIEIPEIGHYIDPSHDQFHKHTKSKRKNVPTIKGNFPDNAIKIGRIGDEHYKTHYHDAEDDQ